MENQLIAFSIQTLSIENFDNESQKSITISLSCNSTITSSQFPFAFQLLLPSPQESDPIILEFHYKSQKFAKSQISIPHSLPSSTTFTIFPLTQLELSPEKQRPSELDNVSKSIGSGQAHIDYLNEKTDSDHIQSSICHNIALNLEKLIRHQDNFSIKEVENLRVLIIGLNSKLKTLVILQQRLESSEKFSRNCLEKRELMQESIQNTCEKLNEHNQTLDQQFSNINEEKKSLQNSLNDLQEQFRAKCLENDDLQGELKIKQSEVTNLKIQLKNFDDMEKFIRNLQDEKKKLEEERQKLREEFCDRIKEFEANAKEKDLELFSREEEIARLVEVVKGKDEEIAVACGVNNEKQTRIVELESQVEECLRVIKAYEDLEQKCQAMELLAKTHQHECVQLQNTITSNLHSYESTILQLDKEKQDLHNKIDLISKDLSKTTTELHEKINLYRSEQIITQDLRTKSTIIQQKLCNTVDISKLFNQIKYLSTSMTDLREKLIEDNDELTRQILQLASDYLNAVTVIQQVRDVIEDRDNEINILRDLIAELQNKTIYYPVKDDPVDEAIADYLNSRSEPLPIIFIREDYGLYLFGTKRVFIKLENNKITIRVGGGFMRIDEFVNTYTPIELEKINERKSERNKPGRKALMGKVLDNIVGNKSANKEVSNNQAVKIIQEAFTSQTNFSKCIVAPRKTSANRVNRSRTLKD